MALHISDTVIKQQLSSLLFVKSVCETRIQRLNDGLDEPDIGLHGVSTVDMGLQEIIYRVLVFYAAK